MLFSKIIPSFFTIKEGSTSHLGLLQWSLHPLRFPRLRGTETLGKKRKTALRCSEPLRYKVGGPKRSAPCCAGWDRLGKRVLSLKFIWFTACIRGILSIYCEFLGILEYADEFTTQSSFYTSNGLSREVMSAC